MFCLNNKIHFSLANANNSASFKRKMVLNHRFCSFTTTNKLVNEAANDSARVSGQDRKKTARSRNQSDSRIWRIPPARKLRKKEMFIRMYTIKLNTDRLYTCMYALDTYAKPLKENSQLERTYYCIHIIKHSNIKV